MLHAAPPAVIQPVGDVDRGSGRRHQLSSSYSVFEAPSRHCHLRDTAPAVDVSRLSSGRTPVSPSVVDAESRRRSISLGKRPVEEVPDAVVGGDFVFLFCLAFSSFCLEDRRGVLLSASHGHGRTGTETRNSMR